MPSVLNFYSKQFYESQLIATICGKNSDEAKKLRSLKNILPVFLTKKEKNPFGLFFVDVSDGNCIRPSNKKSWSNPEEFNVVSINQKEIYSKFYEQKEYYLMFFFYLQIFNLALKLIEKKTIKPDEIGIISPYHAQVMEIRKKLISKNMQKIHVGTVEEFQGTEKNIILISTVKTSGLPKALKFIFCPKRMNSAISRARLVQFIRFILNINIYLHIFF